MSSKNVDRLIDALEESSNQNDFRPLLDGFRSLLCGNGIDADRIQVPMIKPLGFRHPTIWGVLLTWHRQRKFADTHIVTHNDAEKNDTAVDGRFQTNLLHKRRRNRKGIRFLAYPIAIQ